MSSLTIEHHLDAETIRSALVADARRGLTASPKDLPPKWFYDERGSILFDEITRLAEYYPTRTERTIIERRANDIVTASGADTVVELGSGTSEKTRLLLDAFHRAGRLRTFIPFDVSTEILESSATEIAKDYPQTSVHAVAGDFEQHLGHIPKHGTRLLAFLGGTIGNFAPAPRRSFLAALAATLTAGETLLLGTDLVKDPKRLVRAYDDASGVTAAFNRNVLRVLNRELGADFDPADFDHVVRWDAENEWIEMWLRARRSLTVSIPDLQLEVDFEADEAMRTEISAKFTRDRVAENLQAAGFALEDWWTDDAGDFALSLGRRI